MSDPQDVGLHERVSALEACISNGLRESIKTLQADVKQLQATLARMGWVLAGGVGTFIVSQIILHFI
jgi:hypothetical protein